MNTSIGRTILLGVACVQLITAAVIIGWYYFSVRSDIDRFVDRTAQETVLRSIEVIEEFFNPTETSIKSAQQLISREILDRDRPEQLVRYLHDLLQLSPQFSGAYVGYPDGSFYYVLRDDKESYQGTRTKIIRNRSGSREVLLIWRDDQYALTETAQDPDDDYDPRTRPWYLAAQETDKVVWTDPYVFFTSGQPGITAAVAVDKTPGGQSPVVGIDIEIDQISSYLGKIALGLRRSAFLLSPQGDIISHSSFDPVIPSETAQDGPRFHTLAEAEDIDQSIRDDIQARISVQSDSNAPTVWHTQTDDGTYIVAMGRISSADWPWYIVTIQPEDSIIRGAGTGLSLLIAVILASVLGIALGGLLARNIGQPFAALRHNATLARRGNFELMDEIDSGYREIDDIGTTLSELAQRQRRSASSGSTKSK